MTDISLETGLPTLPEPDLFWRVREVKRSYGFNPFDSERSGVYVEVVRRTTETKHVDNVVSFWPFELTWGVKEVSEDVEELVVRKLITKQVTYQRDKYDDEDNIIGVTDVTTDEPIYGDDLTAELISETAEQVHARLIDVLKSRGYLGDYPPKKLEA